MQIIQIVLQTVQNQEPNVGAILEQELTSTGFDDVNAILLYYAPVTMRKAITYFKNNNSENPIVDGLNVVLPIFARIYSQTRVNIAKENDTQKVITVFLCQRLIYFSNLYIIIKNKIRRVEK